MCLNHSKSIPHLWSWKCCLPRNWSLVSKNLGPTGLGGLPTPRVAPCAGVIHSTLLLLPEPQKWQLDFGLFVSRSQFAPAARAHSYFQVPYSFLIFCCSRRSLSRCRNCSKGSQIPACLTCKVVIGGHQRVLQEVRWVCCEGCAVERIPD